MCLLALHVARAPSRRVLEGLLQTTGAVEGLLQTIGAHDDGITQAGARAAITFGDYKQKEQFYKCCHSVVGCCWLRQQRPTTQKSDSPRGSALWSPAITKEDPADTTECFVSEHAFPTAGSASTTSAEAAPKPIPLDRPGRPSSDRDLRIMGTGCSSKQPLAQKKGTSTPSNTAAPVACCWISVVL